MLRFKARIGKVDAKLFYLTIILTLLGLVAVADASAPQALSAFNDRFYYVKQQLFWASLGLIGLLAASVINYKFWQKVALPVLLLSLISLIVVLIPGVGAKVLGARRWIVIGPLNFQPSELAKFALCLSFAELSFKNKKILPFLILLGSYCLLIMLQPDLGTALIIAAIGFIQMFVAEVNIFHYLGSIIAALFLSTGAILLSDYRKDRLLTFLEQTQDPLGKSYHIRQILLSLGLGGMFGVGIGASRQKYLFLPEAATDSIFAVIAEEVGFLGGAILILLFTWLILRGLRIARTAPDRFSKILATGLISWIGIQSFFNIGSMVALVPLTGVPLPLFSYGGSSLSTILVSLGILLNISRHSQWKEKK